MDTKNNRFEVLDSLRGFAACGVMLFHYLYVYQSESGYDKEPLVQFKYGFFGVQLFFLISGFVIYFSITKSKTVKDFLIKRFIRLYPTYWFCLVITFIVVSYFGISAERNTTLYEAVVNFTMVQGLFHVKHVDSSYWSLQIELFFYFFIAILFLAKAQKHLYITLCGWLILIFFYNFIYKIPVAGLLFNLQYGMFFIAGIGFYRVKVLKDNSLINHGIIFLSYLAALTVLHHMEGDSVAVTIIYILFYLAVYDKLSFIQNSFFLFFGRISYALYLIHHHIGLVILKQLKMMGYGHPLFVIVPVAVSILLAWLITDYYEKYVSNILRRKLTSHTAKTISLA